MTSAPGIPRSGRLSELPIDTLKIDPAFVSRLPVDRAARTLVSTIISLAHGLDLSVTAEGVETHEQLEMLRQMGCDHSQGYLHSKPVTREEFSAAPAAGQGMADAARRFRHRAGAVARPDLRTGQRDLTAGAPLRA